MQCTSACTKGVGCFARVTAEHIGKRAGVQDPNGRNVHGPYATRSAKNADSQFSPCSPRTTRAEQLPQQRAAQMHLLARQRNLWCKPERVLTVSVATLA